MCEFCVRGNGRVSRCAEREGSSTYYPVGFFQKVLELVEAELAAGGRRIPFTQQIIEGRCQVHSWSELEIRGWGSLIVASR